MNPEDLVHGESFRDKISTVSDKGNRRWIYASRQKGRFNFYRNLTAYSLLAVFILLPFIKYKGESFFLLNFIAGKFILFGKIIWPQDFYIFSLGMIIFIVFIILFTVVYGRLFCGWVCPQTLFMEFIFRPIENLIEGSVNQQIKNDAAQLNGPILYRKILKHFVFILISFLFIQLFLIYFIGIDQYIIILKSPISDSYVLITGIIFFTLIFYSVYAYIREIVCTVICPYGRLQGVMFDKDTMQISYDYIRGEPRGKLIKKGPELSQGDCIDCKKCVYVCPTGIDIRNGVQLDCIGCTACIDACDEVMTKIKKPLGLIKYASENQIRLKAPFHFTNRIKAYSFLLVFLISIMASLLFSMKSINIQISRAGSQLYQELPNGRMSNLYMAKIVNKTKETFPIHLELENLKGEIQIIGDQSNLLKKESINDITFFIVLDTSKVQKHSTKLNVGFYKNGVKIQTIETKFLGPFK